MPPIIGGILLCVRFKIVSHYGVLGLNGMDAVGSGAVRRHVAVAVSEKREEVQISGSCIGGDILKKLVENNYRQPLKTKLF